MENFRNQVKRTLAMSEKEKKSYMQEQAQDWYSKHIAEEQMTKELANTALDFFPGVGDIKGAVEAIVGKTATDQPMKWWERGLSIAGALPLVPSVVGLTDTIRKLIKVPVITGATDSVLKGLKADLVNEGNVIVYHATKKPLSIMKEGIKKSTAGVIRKDPEGAKVFFTHNPDAAVMAFDYEEDLKRRVLPNYKVSKGDTFAIKVSVPAKDIVVKPNGDIVLNRDIGSNEIVDVISKSGKSILSLKR